MHELEAGRVTLESAMGLKRGRLHHISPRISGRFYEKSDVRREPLKINAAVDGDDDDS